MTSVPKSGTHLLHQILAGMPSITSKGFDPQRLFLNEEINNIISRLKLLKSNEFGYGHIHYSKKMANILEDLQIKHIFIYRDPRDVLISSMFHISKVISDPLYNDVHSKYLTKNQRLAAMLNGVVGKFDPFFQARFPFYRWLEDKRTFHISFEQLIKSDTSRKKVLLQVVNFLWNGIVPPLPYEEIVKKMIQNIDPSTCPTYRTGTIGSWKIEFDEEIKSLFKEKAGELLTRYGFEKDNDW